MGIGWATSGPVGPAEALLPKDLPVAGDSDRQRRRSVLDQCRGQSLFYGLEVHLRTVALPSWTVVGWSCGRSLCSWPRESLPSSGCPWPSGPCHGSRTISTPGSYCSASTHRLLLHHWSGP